MEDASLAHAIHEQNALATKDVVRQARPEALQSVDLERLRGDIGERTDLLRLQMPVMMFVVVVVLRLLAQPVIRARGESVVHPERTDIKQEPEIDVAVRRAEDRRIRIQLPQRGL